LKPELTPKRIAAAWTVALVADVIQLPISLSVATGILAIPAETVDVAVDIGVMILLSALLGFHYAFLPTFVLEVIPGAGLLPTWTGSVAYVIWQRKKARTNLSPESSRKLDY
jgi:hypothetical protein